MQKPEIKTRTRVSLGFFVPIVLLAVLGAVSVYSIRSLVVTQTAVEHSHDVLAASQAVLTSAIDMETGMRGYLLTGQEEFLEPYNTGSQLAFERILELKIEVSDTPLQVERLNRAEQVLQEWQSKVVTPNVALRREIGDGKTMTDLASLIGERKGKEHFDRIRSDLDKFSAREEMILEDGGKNHPGHPTKHKLDLAIANGGSSHMMVLLVASKLAKSVVDMETGMRGYLLASDERFLEPYYNGLSDLNIQLDTLEEAVKGDSRQETLLGDIKENILQWQTEVAEPMIEMRREINTSSSMDMMADLIAEARGKFYFDEIRSVLNAFMETQRTILNAQEQASAEQVRAGFIIILSCIGFSIGFGAFVAWLSGKTIANPIVEMTDAMKNLSAGSLEVNVPSLGRADELGDMAGAVKIFKEAMIEISDARKAAEEANSAKSEFLATISHEIRTPMNGVIGLAQLLQKETLTSVQRQYIDDLLNSSNSMVAILNDILDLSKVESGKLDLSPINFNIANMLSGAASSFRELASRNGLVLETKFDFPNDTVLFADEMRIRQILWNLVSNAMKFTGEGSVTIHVSIKDENGKPIASIANGAEERVARLFIHVVDTGLGISKDKQASIFNAFEQADNTITREFGGTGLGLAIVSQLVRLMKGEISLQSTQDVGSAFSVELPVTRTFGEVAVVKPSAHADMQALNILIADDQALNLTIASSLLLLAGHYVTTVNNGAEAVEAHKNGSFDMVLLDYHMPVMDGAGATREIRAMDDPVRSQVPIVGMTADAFDTTRTKLMDLGMDDVLTKPFLEEDLLACIARNSIDMEFSDDLLEDLELELEIDVPVLQGDKEILEEQILNTMKSALGSEFYDFLDIAIDNLHSLAEELKSSVNSQGAENTPTILMHSIKGVSGTVGAMDLAEKAAHAEKSCETKSVEQVQIENILDSAEKTDTALRKFRASA